MGKPRTGREEDKGNIAEVEMKLLE